MESILKGGEIMGNTKRELFIFAASDINAMEDHFEEMARKGWMLDKVGEYSVKYKKMDPRELKFDIDLFPKLSAFDYPDNEDVMEYRNLCIDAGWEFIAATNKFQVFYSDKKDNLPPIQTDDRIKQSIVNKSLLFEIIILAICLPIFIRSIGKLFPLDYNMLDSNISIAITIIGPIFIIPIVVYIFSDIIWMLRAKIAINRGNSLPKTNYKHLRYKILLLLYPSLLFILLFVIGLIFDLLSGNITGLLSILPTTIGLTVGTLFRKNKNRENRSKDKNIIIFILVIIVVIIGFNVIMPKLYNINEAEELKEGYKGLSLKNFELGSPDYARFSKGGSIILPKYSNYYETTLGDDRHYINKDYISTDYIKAINNNIAKYLFDRVVQESISKYNGSIISEKEKYTDFDEAFSVEHNGNNRLTLLLLRDDEVFKINSNLDLSNEDNIKVIINKLSNQ